MDVSGTKFSSASQTPTDKGSNPYAVFNQKGGDGKCKICIPIEFSVFPFLPWTQNAQTATFYVSDNYVRLGWIGSTHHNNILNCNWITKPI